MGRTWGDLKKKVFSYLELDRETTGDVMEAVQEALHDTLLDISQELNPHILYTSSSEVSLVNPATSLSLITDFSITDLDELRAVTIDESPSDSTTEPIAWGEYPWENWQLRQGALPQRVYTLDPDQDTIHFSPGPSSGITWGVNLHYIKMIAAYNDALEPEIKDGHRTTLAYGAAIMFPQYFGPDRQMVLSNLLARYQGGRARIMRDMPKYRTLKRFRLSGKGRSKGTINWGNDIHS